MSPAEQSARSERSILDALSARRTAVQSSPDGSEYDPSLDAVACEQQVPLGVVTEERNPSTAEVEVAAQADEVDDVQFRRRVPRLAASWPGTYVVEPGTDWDSCRVLELSLLGVGLELFGPIPDDVVGRRIVVEVQTGSGTSLTLRMSGEVRYTSPGASGGVRVGLEFTGLSPIERSVLESLERLRVGW